MPTDTLSMKEAAEALGVHYMTVYRYVRLGMLPAVKVGAAWQIERSDLEALQRSAERPRGAPTGVDWERRLHDRLLAGDENGAWGVVEAALASGAAPDQIYLAMLAPALRTIGEAWAAGEIDVADEHIASAVAQRIVGRLGPRFKRRGRSRGSVVAATPAHELHSLPLAMVCDLLRGAHFDVIDLGTNVPPASLARTVAQADRLVAVAISATTGDTDGHIRAAVEAVRSANNEVPILLGGRAVRDAGHAHRLGADDWVADGTAAVEWVEAQLR